ncbi:MAG: O-antigen ligase family protein, partial [Solirubrobacterales bacterium]
LAGWSLISIAWTPLNDIAVQDAERALLYATVFALGLWSCLLAGRRMLLLPLAVVAVTGAAIGIVITVTLAAGTDVASIVHFDDATLRFPIGYRNADAAFLLICLWPIVVLAAEGGLAWPLRALLVGAATMLLDLAVLAQSRGVLPALVVALVVFVALSPRRLRAATYLVLAVLPVLPALPALLDVFQYGRGDPGIVPVFRDTAKAIALSSVGSIALAAVCIRGVEARLDLGPRRVQLLSRAAAAVVVLVVAVGGTLFVARQGGPIEFVDQRLSEFKQGESPNLSSEGSRFGFNAGTNRGDLWRVALDQGREDPFRGGGAGSFQIAYLKDRDSNETPRDPHSVELLMFSELGIVGFAIFAAFLLSTVVGGMRSRRLSRPAAALTAGSFSAGAYWLTHASYDWFWAYPALTAPVMFLFGAACAPAIFDPAPGRRSRGRWAAVAVLAVGAVAAIPLFFAQSYANRAYDESVDNPAAALTDLDRAARLNPFDAEPLLSEGVIASRLGDRGRALDAFRDAVDREPENYAGYYFLALELERSDPGAARVAAREALRLNPLDRRARALDRRLERRRGP